MLHRNSKLNLTFFSSKSLFQDLKTLERYKRLNDWKSFVNSTKNICEWQQSENDISLHHRVDRILIRLQSIKHLYFWTSLASKQANEPQSWSVITMTIMINHCFNSSACRTANWMHFIGTTMRSICSVNYLFECWQIFVIFLWILKILN